MKVEESMKRLSEFLPSDKRLAILNELLNIYDEKELAGMLKCDPSLIPEWLESSPNNGYMPKILEIAFQRSSNTMDVLKETLKEFDSLCSSFGIKDAGTKLDKFMSGIDDKSKQIIWHMLRTGHANIREVAALIDADTDNDVLVRVREVINPLSKKIFGKEIMKFESTKIDPATGNKILFSWWLTEKLLEFDSADEMLDVFDEKNCVKIVAELPPVEEKDIKIDTEGNILTISAKDYHKNIPLFCPVKRIIEKTYRNGILELRIEKAIR
ncbi:MAG: Hsp20/alpha crystallin family protein [Candidatus Thermoplasmatota archaeon]|nr:Hsp20/alpha crystallin family protein [Candidatus Thermoplasmatota archaeon]